jgi:hypothetical protein
VRMIHGARARPIQKDGTLQRFLLGGHGPAPTVGQPWGDPPGASACNDHAAFASGCGPYLVRMIHGARARPIQKDGTLQRFLLGGHGPQCTNRGSAEGRPAVETSVVCIGVGSCVLPNVPAEARARLQRCSRLTSPMIRLLRGVCQHPSPLMSRGGLTLWLLQLAP